MTFIALPESTFMSSIIQMLEAKLEATEVQMRYSSLAVGMPQDCGCVRRATESRELKEGGTEQRETNGRIG